MKKTGRRAPGKPGYDLGVPPEALTKADYDRIMATRTRNLTDGPIGSRTQGTNPDDVLTDFDMNGKTIDP